MLNGESSVKYLKVKAIFQNMHMGLDSTEMGEHGTWVSGKGEAGIWARCFFDLSCLLVTVAPLN